MTKITLTLREKKEVAEGTMAMILALLMQGLFELLERFLVPRGLRLRPETG